MTAEHPPEPSPELGRLLRALGEAPTSTASDERMREREAHIVARIDAELASLVRARRIARRGYVALAAAVIVLVGAGAVALRAPSRAVVIQREALPPVPARVSKPEPSRTAATASSANDPPRRRRLDPPRLEPKPEITTLAPQPEPPAPGPEPPNSTLARENQLFREAADASRRGDLERALTGFDELFQNHSTSPLAQTALVRRFRLLAKAGRTDEARRDAKRYLGTFPNGFAAGEARALLAGVLDAGAEREAPP
jgi:hypothetical protein